MRMPIRGTYPGERLSGREVLLVLLALCLLGALVGGAVLLYRHAYTQGSIAARKAVLAQARQVAREDMEEVMRQHCVMWFDAKRARKAERDIVACRGLPFMQTGVSK